VVIMPSARSQSTTNGSKPKPRINNQKSRNWPESKSSCVTTKIVPIAEHSRNSRKRQIPKGHRFSIQKTSVVHEKTTTPRSGLRWKPTGKIFKTVGLRWVPTGKIFTSSTTKVDSEPQNGSNEDITNQYECEQTLDVSAGTLNLSAVQMTSDHNSSELGIHDHSNELSSSKLVLKVVPPVDKTSRQELELLFHHHITMLRITMLIADIEDDIQDPDDAMHNPPSHSSFLSKETCSHLSREIHSTTIDLLTPRLVNI
ncbi:hypothetical protein Tco_1117100, partial [Tanacetum coccineum]